MNYSFPQITHINDVLPAIADRDEFIVVQKDGYQVVNYAVMMEDSFPPVHTAGGSATMREEATRNKSILRECRGLIFDLDGKILARRYHKFFNVNEREETQLEKVDFTKPHRILEKLDGSMVSPIMINGVIRWTTKMGITDTSMEAEVHVVKNPQYVKFVTEVMADGWTPVFEWCSNKNRIVLDYPQDQLVLTAVRNNEVGDYVRYELLEAYGRLHNIPVVKSYDFKDENIIDVVRAMENQEGVVVRFNDGHMLKIKADWYVLRHKSKDAITREKNVLDYIVNERVDDVLPFLQVDDQARLMKFQDAFWLGLAITIEKYVSYVNAIKVDRRTWAIESMPAVKLTDPNLAHIVFAAFNGKSARDSVVELVRKNIGTQSRVEEIRFMWGGHKWSYDFEG